MAPSLRVDGVERTGFRAEQQPLPGQSEAAANGAVGSKAEPDSGDGTGSDFGQRWRILRGRRNEWERRAERDCEAQWADGAKHTPSLRDGAAGATKEKVNKSSRAEC